jgi:hypothetical protein
MHFFATPTAKLALTLATFLAIGSTNPVQQAAQQQQPLGLAKDSSSGASTPTPTTHTSSALTTVDSLVLNPFAFQREAQEQPLAKKPTSLSTSTTTNTIGPTTTSTATITMTRYVESAGVTSVPTAVQTWYAGQKETGCDRTACASCRVWYNCDDQGEW